MGFRLLQESGMEMTALGRVDTPFGPSQPMHLLRDSGVLYLSRHGERSYEVSAPYVNYRANVWALKELGVEQVIAWSGPAALDESFAIGEIFVPTDIIDETRRRDYTFFEGLGLGFVRQSPTFCPTLTAALSSACSDRMGNCRKDGVYVCTEGPRLETAAEIRKFRAFGGHLVGMTLVPEAFLAKELEMCYAALCYITNYAEGVRPREFRAGTLFEGLLDESESSAVDNAVARLPEIALATIASLTGEKACACPRLMERYRRRGDISEDWRSWITKPQS
jgi:5'-methylthioadenosine phosphorylase